MLDNTSSATAITSTKLNANNQTIFGRNNLPFTNVETVGSNIFPFPIHYNVLSKSNTIQEIIKFFCYSITGGRSEIILIEVQELEEEG